MRKKNNAEGLLYPAALSEFFYFFVKKINAAKGFSTSFRIYFKTLRIELFMAPSSVATDPGSRQ
jgi:hypothetical protein